MMSVQPGFGQFYCGKCPDVVGNPWMNVPQPHTQGMETKM